MLSRIFQRSNGWPLALIALSLAAGLVVVSGVGAPIRPAVTLCFLAICPGGAFIHLLRIEDMLAKVTIAVALSLALDTIVALAMVLPGIWSPGWGLFVLICVSIVGVALRIGRVANRRAAVRGEAL